MSSSYEIISSGPTYLCLSSKSGRKNWVEKVFEEQIMAKIIYIWQEIQTWIQKFQQILKRINKNLHLGVSYLYCGKLKIKRKISKKKIRGKKNIGEQ